MSDEAGQLSDARLEASTDDLYDRAPCALLSTLPDGLIIRANQTFLDWVGEPRAAVVGRVRFQALLTVGARIYYETHYAPLLQMQGFVHEIALDVRRTDGRVCPVVASARQIRDADGRTPIVTRIALFDSTDRRRYEHELVLMRTRAEQAAADLADADRRKNEFIAMLAHELRNPLAPIRNAVEMLRRSDHADDIGRRTTAMLQRQVGQMVRLVEDLLDVSRIGQEKLALRRVPVDLASVVDHAMETSEPLLRNAGVRFTSMLPPAPIYVEADAARLAQAIGNILNNAAKFTPRDGSVSLRLERDGPEALICIRDTGIGIEEGQLSRVFDLFMQADVSLERRGGLGIGLTLAKSLVERHNGRITAHSAGRGTGTEFVVRLPALDDPLKDVSRPFTPSTVGIRATRRRVLVVDDNRDAAELIALSLGFDGHDVRQAYDGLEALETAATFQPHVVLLDIGLPRLNGYEVAQRMAKQSGLKPVLVALTGWGQEEDRRRSSAAGFDVHLVKPVDHDVLAALIADLAPSDAS